MKSGWSLERIGFVLLAAGLGLIQFSIKSEIILGLALIAWLGILVQGFKGSRVQGFEVPAFFWALVALMAWTLLSSAMSADPVYSLERAKQFLLFLIVPVTMRFGRGHRAGTIIDVIIALGSVAAIVGIVQWAALGYDETNRPRGSLGHWMTYSGILMLVVCAAASRLIFLKKRGRWIWPAVAVPSLLVALVASYTRNAWIGTLAGIGTLLALRSKRLLIALPVLILIAGAVPSVRSRAMESFDPYFPGNQDRVAMLKAGVAMVKDHPLFGVGMNMVPREYLKYRTSDARDSADAKGPETRSHLHNVPMQLAAERGLPALAAWLWFVIAAGAGLWRLFRRNASKAVAGAGLAALIAMVVAGLFEHNFGDSEFLVLFLALITLPFAADDREHTES
jgi:putative inorganic carbon (HCO3(-)) transporter